MGLLFQTFPVHFVLLRKGASDSPDIVYAPTSEQELRVGCICNVEDRKRKNQRMMVSQWLSPHNIVFWPGGGIRGRILKDAGTWVEKITSR